MLNTAQQRKWAALLRERYTGGDYSPDDVAAAIAQADLIEARADLEDAKAGREKVISDGCAMVEDYPILGRITREGGKRTNIEHPWSDADIARVEAAGIMICFEFADDPHAGLGQGKLCRIYIGTREHGPIAQWDDASKEWHRLHSNGNYGKRWAFGGTWSAEKIGHKTLSTCCPEVAKVLNR